jgi:hypothetical protein
MSAKKKKYKLITGKLLPSPMGMANRKKVPARVITKIIKRKRTAKLTNDNFLSRGCDIEYQDLPIILKNIKNNIGKEYQIVVEDSGQFLTNPTTKEDFVGKCSVGHRTCYNFARIKISKPRAGMCILNFIYSRNDHLVIARQNARFVKRKYEYHRNIGLNTAKKKHMVESWGKELDEIKKFLSSCDEIGKKIPLKIDNMSDEEIARKLQNKLNVKNTRIYKLEISGDRAYKIQKLVKIKEIGYQASYNVYKHYVDFSKRKCKLHTVKELDCVFLENTIVSAKPKIVADSEDFSDPSTNVWVRGEIRYIAKHIPNKNIHRYSDYTPPAYDTKHCAVWFDLENNIIKDNNGKIFKSVNGEEMCELIKEKSGGIE